MYSSSPSKHVSGVEYEIKTAWCLQQTFPSLTKKSITLNLKWDENQESEEEERFKNSDARFESQIKAAT